MSSPTQRAARKAADNATAAAKAKYSDALAQLLAAIMLSAMDAPAKLRIARLLGAYEDDARLCLDDIQETAELLPAVTRPLAAKCAAAARRLIATWEGQ